MTGTAPELSPEITAEHAARLESVNAALEGHGLAGGFAHVGIVQQGELAVLGVEGVTSLGDGGYNLVSLPTKFKPDTIDPATGQPKPGAQGYFRLIFQSQELADNSHLIVPLVDDAPGGNEIPHDLHVDDERLQRINQTLAAHDLRGFAHPTNAEVDTIEGLADLNTENENYFSVAIVNVRHPDGSVTQEPFVINAHSVEGVDGSIFPAIVRLPMYAGEPRLQLGGNYRPTMGRLVTEVSRGFYKKGQGREGLRIPRITDSSVEGIAAAAQILRGETGIDVSAEAGAAIEYRGSVKQDPRFEYNRVSQYGVSLKVARLSPRELQASEAISIMYANIGDVFSQLPQMEDAFSVMSLSRELAARGILGLSSEGKAATDNNRRLALQARYQVQYGEHGREVIRGNPLEANYMDLDASLGRLAVNTGIARMTPEVYAGTTSWESLRQSAERSHTSLRLLTPEQALAAVQDGSLDVVTGAATVKVLHGMGYLGVNWEKLAAA